MPSSKRVLLLHVQMGNPAVEALGQYPDCLLRIAHQAHCDPDQALCRPDALRLAGSQGAYLLQRPQYCTLGHQARENLLLDGTEDLKNPESQLTSNDR